MKTGLFYLEVILIVVLFSPSFMVSSAKTQLEPTKQKLFSSTNYTPVFRDDFDSTTLNPDIWQVYTNGGTVKVDSGWVTLSRPGAGRTFPYVHTKYNPIPSNGNFVVKLGFQYLTAAIHGDGFSVDDRLPANGSPGAYAWQPTIYTIWQGTKQPDEGFYIMDYTGSRRYYAPSPHLQYHDIEFRWLDNTDEYYIDGQLVNVITRSLSVPRPVDLWFGNPVIPPGSTTWTSFKIDYIEVASLGTPTPFFDLPVNYPGRGNSTNIEKQFVSAWQKCTTAFFDHKQPEEWRRPLADGWLWFWTGGKIPAGTRDHCDLFQNCYDGHEGYDFDDDTCYGKAVFPVAAGEVVASETGSFNDGYGNRVVIQHGNTGYKTLYGHLAQILVSSGSVDKNTPIGLIGNTGCAQSGCGTHLHLNVDYEGKLVDPSGWEGNYEDPYVQYRGGPKSYRLWLYSPRRSTPVNNTLGTSLISPSNNTIVSILPNAYSDDFEIILTELAPIALPSQLVSAGHGFMLQARNLSGENIPSLNQNISIQIQFSTDDIKGIRSNTLSLYVWDTTLNTWMPLPTTISLPTTTSNTSAQSLGLATTVTRDTGYIALLGEPYVVYLPLILK